MADLKSFEPQLPMKFPVRNTLISLVQGLGIKVPTEITAPQVKHVKVESGISIVVKPRHPSPGSPRRVRPASPKSISPRAMSPRVRSPRPRSPATSRFTSARPTSPRPISPYHVRPKSPSRSLPNMLKQTKKPVLASALKSPVKVTQSKPVSRLKTTPKVSFATNSSKSLPVRSKKEPPVAEAPPPLSPQAMRELEASKAMVSPTIDFDSLRSSSPKSAAAPPPPKKKSPTLRAKKEKERRNTVLKGLVTKVESTNDPADAGKSKAEIIKKKHLYQTFRGLKMARGLPPADPMQLQAKRVVLMKPPGKYRRKTAIFDLDETLVHCLDKSESGVPDVVLPIRFPNGDIVHVRDM